MKDEYMKNEKKHTIYEIIYFISTYFIAVIAILGFIYSINSSKKMSKTLESFNESIADFTEPVIKFNDYTYFYDKDKKMDCENAPIGIHFTYINKSIIPIKLNGVCEISYGEMKFSTDRIKEINQSEDPIIISPGETNGTTMLRKEDFKMLLNKKGIFAPPFLKIHFNGYVSNLSETRKYKVELITAIGVDCEQPTQRSITSIKEDYTLVAN